MIQRKEQKNCDRDFAIRVDAHRKNLVNYAMQYCKCRALAEDLAADSIIKAIEKQHLYKEQQQLREWLCKIVYNEFINHYRKSKRSVDIETLHEKHTACPDSVTSQLGETEIRKCINSINEEQAEIIKFRLAGYSYQEISTLTGIDINLARARVHLAKNKLGKMLKIKRGNNPTPKSKPKPTLARVY